MYCGFSGELPVYWCVDVSATSDVGRVIEILGMSVVCVAADLTLGVVVCLRPRVSPRCSEES
jgi:hypothetical protein